MLVETYEVSEARDVAAPECEAEAIALIESLGLTGQQELVRPKEDGTAERIPYRLMTDEECFVYENICPTRTRADKYESGMIPLRVLQVLAHATSLECFRFFEIWHPTDFKMKDPVLVGCMGDSDWSVKRYILARWGEVLDDFPALKKVASELARNSKLAELTKEISEKKQHIEMLTDCKGETVPEVLKRVNRGW